MPSTAKVNINNKLKIKMEKEFIPYEQSRVLKELGFNESCFGYYTCFYKTDLIKEGVIGCMNSALEETEIAAPLYQQAFRWFREKYNLQANIDTETELECLNKLIEIVKINVNNKNINYG